ncbi:MAG: PRC-barrel domain-containing protein [Dehalococcoidia bacterium]|nr:PRC-barrel domain-containing protein [Dehalococcoidia bacterium]
MPTVREHLNKPVISSTNGEKLGKIKDLYLDPKLTRVVAVYLGRKGVVTRKKQMIEQDKVQTCGKDAWLVVRGDVVVDSGQIVGSRNLVPSREVRGRKILSEGGTEIATVGDVILDGECNVKGFTLANYPASGPLTERKAIALGAFTSLGSKTSPMTTTLAKAESMEIGVPVETGTSTGIGTSTGTAT